MCLKIGGKSMIFHHNNKEEQDLNKDIGEKQVIDIDGEVRKEKTRKIGKVIRTFLLPLFLLLLILFIMKGGYQIPKEVSLADDYQVYVNGRLTSYRIEKIYHKDYLPFLFYEEGKDSFVFDDLHDNSEISISSSIPFVLERYGCYKEGKKVNCDNAKDMKQILEGNNSSFSYDRKTLSVDNYVMKIYRSPCEIAGNPIYEGKILSDIGKYLTDVHNYCIYLEWKEDKHTKTVIPIELNVG